MEAPKASSLYLVEDVTRGVEGLDDERQLVAAYFDAFPWEPRPPEEVFSAEAFLAFLDA